MEAARCGLFFLFLLNNPVGQRVDHGLDLVVGADRFVRGFVEVEVFRVEDDVDVAGVRKLAQLERGELDLRRAAAAKDVHVSDRGLLEASVHVVRDLGDQ